MATTTTNTNDSNSGVTPVDGTTNDTTATTTATIAAASVETASETSNATTTTATAAATTDLASVSDAPATVSPSINSTDEDTNNNNNNNNTSSTEPLPPSAPVAATAALSTAPAEGRLMRIVREYLDSCPIHYTPLPPSYDPATGNTTHMLSIMLTGLHSSFRTLVRVQEDHPGVVMVLVYCPVKVPVRQSSSSNNNSSNNNGSRTASTATSADTATNGGSRASPDNNNSNNSNNNNNNPTSDTSPLEESGPNSTVAAMNELLMRINYSLAMGSFEMQNKSNAPHFQSQRRQQSDVFHPLQRNTTPTSWTHTASHNNNTITATTAQAVTATNPATPTNSSSSLSSSPSACWLSEEGQIRLRSSIVVPSDATLTIPMVKGLVMIAAATMDRFFPALMLVRYGQMPPRQAWQHCRQPDVAAAAAAAAAAYHANGGNSVSSNFRQRGRPRRSSHHANNSSTSSSSGGTNGLEQSQ